MDKIKGVITGDIIDSSAIQIEYRDFLLKSIQKIAEELNVIEPLKIEFFRGDSFQMVINNPENAMQIAILLRAGLKSHTPKGCEKPWDARLSLGVGIYHTMQTMLYFLTERRSNTREENLTRWANGGSSSKQDGRT